MHPTIGHQLINQRVADLHRQAHHDRLARTARQGRRTRSRQFRRRMSVPRVAITRHVLAVLGNRAP